ncbi:MAG: sigma-70 family RNA polymerase sigma factor [Phycisphaerales bacterium]
MRKPARQSDPPSSPSSSSSDAAPTDSTPRPTAAAAAAAKETDQWLDTYGDLLYRTALARVRDPHIAEDIVQQTLLAGLQQIGTFRGEAAVSTWLLSILLRKVIDHFRAATRDRGTVRLNPENEASVMNDLINQKGRRSVRLNPILADRSEFWQCLQACLAKLPERHAQVFILYECDGLSTEEICQVLDLTSSNVWVMLHRARLGLRSCMQRVWMDIKQEGKGKH